MLCNLDDVLSVSGHPLSTLQGLQSVFKLEGNKIEEPSMYLGAQFGRIEIEGDFMLWTMSAKKKYVVAEVKKVEESLAKKGLRLPTKCYTPLATDYCPELDTSAELKADGLQYYQES